MFTKCALRLLFVFGTTAIAVIAPPAFATGTVLPVGGTLSFFDADGDHVVISAQGGTGSAIIQERIGDGIGDDDGDMENGEEIGSIAISGAASDFRIGLSHDILGSTGSGGVIHIGNVSASGQIIRGLFADTTSAPNSRFELQKFSGVGFSSGGGIFVTSITGDSDGQGLHIVELSEQTTIKTTEDIAGAIVIRDHVKGTIDTGTALTGKVTIGKNLDSTGLIRTGGNFTGDVVILGNLAGDLMVNGRVYGKWTIAGNVTGDALLQSTDDFNQFYVTESFFGTMIAGQHIWLKVSGSVGSTAVLQAPQVTAFIGVTFFGKIIATTMAYVWVSDSIAPPAKISSGGACTVVIGRTLYPGVVITAPSPSIYYVPNLTTGGTVITRLPYVIATAGNYRLANDLAYAGSNGAAISITTDNVTLDLKGYKILGTAGANTIATGVEAYNRSNITLRNGTISGFLSGTKFENGKKVAQNIKVEDIRASDNWYTGIWIESANIVVKNVQVLRTGGSTVSSAYTRPASFRIYGSNALLQNIIAAGMIRIPQTEELMGIHFREAPGAVLSNVIFSLGVVTNGTWGIWANGTSSVQTDITLRDSLFSKWDYAGGFSEYSGGIYHDTIFLQVANDIVHGIDGGRNVRIN